MLDPTLGSATANSYADEDTADLYFEDRLDTSAWDNSSEKSAALIMACTLLDSLSFKGCRVDSVQALSWPRRNVQLPDTYRIEPSTSIPTCVIQAQCEMALALLKDPESVSPSGLEGFANLQLGALNVTPRGGGQSIPTYVRRLLAPVLVAGMSTPVVRA